jgi:prolyl oligopeptidase
VFGRECALIPRDSILRVARPTDNLHAIEKMYVEGLGFEILGRFEGHEGFDGVMLGHRDCSYYL